MFLQLSFIFVVLELCVAYQASEPSNQFGPPLRRPMQPNFAPVPLPAPIPQQNLPAPTYRPWTGPVHVPVIGPFGVPTETPEVEHERYLQISALQDAYATAEPERDFDKAWDGLEDSERANDAKQQAQKTYQAPQQAYQAPQQAYQAPRPAYQAPQPAYQAPQPAYQPQQQPQAAYQAPQPKPAYQTAFERPQQNYQQPQHGFQNNPLLSRPAYRV